MRRPSAVGVTLAVGAVAVAGVLSAAQVRVDVGLVTVVATVIDENARYVADLTQEDFLVYEDGDLQDIAHFAQSDDLPVSVGILLDTSASMESKIDTAIEAVARFLEQIHPDDEVFLVTFDDRPRLVEDFTGDRRQMARALRDVRLGGGTALYEALALGVEHVRYGRHDKKALLLISDGADTTSSITLNRAELYVRESEMLVYALGIAPDRGTAIGVTGGTPSTFPTGGLGRSPIGIPIPGGLPTPFPTGGRGSPPRTTGPTVTIGADSLDMDVLELFGAISGGRAWEVSGSSDNRRQTQIADALDQIAVELRNQYNIGYYPPHSLEDETWHRIKVETIDPFYNVRHREQYFGDGPK